MIFETWTYNLTIYVFYIFIVTQTGSCIPHTIMKKGVHGRGSPNLQFTTEQGTPTGTDNLIQSPVLHRYPVWVKSLYLTLRTQQNRPTVTERDNFRKKILVERENLRSSQYDHLMSYTLDHVKHKETVVTDPTPRLEEEKSQEMSNHGNSLKSDISDVAVRMNLSNRSPKIQFNSRSRGKREVGQVNLTLTATVRESSDELEGEETLPVEWTAAGNYSAVWLVWKKYNKEKEIARESQLAFMCVVFLLSMLSWAVWCTGMCNVKKVTYKEWNFQSSHDTLTVPEVMKKHWKYLPEESFYEEVVVHDRGTDP